ncbi:MAG: HDOD domain-containing protein [Gemmatimonadaceae bacterium]|nr:HDOD domain-containing protein [Gemmatimonadaceae bacterium]
MAFGWFSKVKQAFGSGGAAATASRPSVAAIEPTPTTAPEPAAEIAPEAYVAFLEHPAPVPPPPPTPTEELIAQLRQHPALKDSPDGPDLLDLLSSSPNAMVRQLPSAAQASLALCDDPGLTRRQLAEKLASDPALVQALLKTANSAAFGAGKDSVISIEPALDRIGVAGARSIIFANAVDGVLSRPGGEFNGMANEVWNHMVRTAPIARALAQAFDANGDEAFAIALLHDVGKLVIFDRISALRSTKRRDVKLAPAFTDALLNSLHEPLGALAARTWGMGERSARAIGFHHCRTSDGEPNTLAEITYVAELADHAVRRGMAVDLHRVWFDGKITADLQRLMKVLDAWEIPIV